LTIFLEGFGAEDESSGGRLLLDIVVRRSLWVFGKSLPKTGLARVNQLTSAKSKRSPGRFLVNEFTLCDVGAPSETDVVFDSIASAA
jgi:hypothetical protein